jgi:hypothetical protein
MFMWSLISPQRVVCHVTLRICSASKFKASFTSPSIEGLPGHNSDPMLPAWTYSGLTDDGYLAGLVEVWRVINHNLKITTGSYCISTNMEVWRNAHYHGLLLGWAPEYRQLLIQSIHVLAVKFSEVVASVVHALMEFLGDWINPSALDVVTFVQFFCPPSLQILFY